MPPTVGKLHAGIPGVLNEELVEVLARGKSTRVERIVSRGQKSPDGFWYDQTEDEWVVVLAGAAKLRFEGKEERFKLIPGDYIHIPAHTRHRVDWTDPDQDTVWLAVFFESA